MRLESLTTRFLQPQSEGTTPDLRKTALALRVLQLSAAAPTTNHAAVPPKVNVPPVLCQIPRLEPPARPQRRRLAFWPAFSLIVSAAALTTIAGAAVFIVLR